MKKMFLSIGILLSIIACNSNNSDQKNITSGMHKAIVSEVIQTDQYTFLRVKESDLESWLAVPKMEVTSGETYYYKDGLHMKNFESKELNRKFNEVIFLDNISKNPITDEKSISAAEPAEHVHSEGDIHSQDAAPAIHQIQAKEILQTKQYTYIKGSENNNEIWIAVAKMDAVAGKTYYFTGGLVMNDFKSKELNRTFSEILFVDNISLNPDVAGNTAPANPQMPQIVSKGSAIELEKKTVSVKHDNDDISIAALLKNKKSFAGKVIKIKAQVIKYTPAIMKKNWIHVQDGTDFSGKFDLTITTDQEVKVGDVITAEGIITLDKDFGFGYFYEVIMENAKINK